MTVLAVFGDDHGSAWPGVLCMGIASAVLYATDERDTHLNTHEYAHRYALLWTLCLIR